MKGNGTKQRKKEGSMDRTEFIDKLQRALAGGVNSSRVAENVQYYREYIDVEIRKGRSEAEVLDSLGDPGFWRRALLRRTSVPVSARERTGRTMRRPRKKAAESGERR